MNQLADSISRDFNCKAAISYSGKFSAYNANVRKRGNELEFSLSREWKTVSDEIILGLLQSLASRVLKKSFSSTSIDLYHNFIRNLQRSTPRTKSDDYLEKAFNRINEKYFDGILEPPNFSWHSSTRRLASYDHHSDTLSVSDVFRCHDDIVDYLVYHELLHKKLKFSGKGRRTIHHSSAFRKLESLYQGREVMERKISSIIRNQNFKY